MISTTEYNSGDKVSHNICERYLIDCFNNIASGYYHVPMGLEPIADKSDVGILLQNILSGFHVGSLLTVRTDVAIPQDLSLILKRGDLTYNTLFISGNFVSLYKCLYKDETDIVINLKNGKVYPNIPSFVSDVEKPYYVKPSILVNSLDLMRNQRKVDKDEFTSLSDFYSTKLRMYKIPYVNYLAKDDKVLKDICNFHDVVIKGVTG